MTKGRSHRWLQLALYARLALDRRGVSWRSVALSAERCAFLPAAGDQPFGAIYNGLKNLVAARGSGDLDDTIAAQLDAAIGALLTAIDLAPADHLGPILRAARSGRADASTDSSHERKKPWWIEREH